VGHDDQSFTRRVSIDVTHALWRERSFSGSGDYVRISNGTDTFRMEADGAEYVRIKAKSKDPDPLPAPYGLADADWSKAVELRRGPCGLRGSDHQCVVVESPVKPNVSFGSGGRQTRMTEGMTRVVIDLETGLLVSSRTSELFQNQNGTIYQADITFKLKALEYGKPADEKLFRLPDGLREVHELGGWDAGKIRKQLVGKPAPDLIARDLHGNPVTLSAFKGKTVLLDFWTTWCPPCRADGSSLEALYKKYSGGDLVIVGVSVDEPRAVVEKFLGEHPHAYPIILTSENEMPRPFQVQSFPTYIVINHDGTIAAAVDGDQGFSELRKLLKKAGLEI